jgi:hypothetical protein
MRRPRLRIWMLMFVVAVAAVAMPSSQLVRRTIVHLELARFHSAKETEYREAIAERRMVDGFCYMSYTTPISAEELSHYAEVATYHRLLSRKHNRYARCPWLRVDPKPPYPGSLQLANITP